MLRRVMAEGQHSHVLWVDADAVVIDQAKTLDSFIQEAGNRKEEPPKPLASDSLGPPDRKQSIRPM